jgi:hypothetical protein
MTRRFGPGDGGTGLNHDMDACECECQYSLAYQAMPSGHCNLISELEICQGRCLFGGWGRALLRIWNLKVGFTK